MSVKEVLIMKIGDNIKKLRVDKGLTQKDLANLLNVTSQAVSKWEKNDSEPDIATIVRISNIFGVSTDDLLNPKNDELIEKANPHEKEITRVIEKRNKNKMKKIKKIFLICTISAVAAGGLTCGGVFGIPAIQKLIEGNKFETIITQKDVYITTQYLSENDEHLCQIRSDKVIRNFTCNIVFESLNKSYHETYKAEELSDNSPISFRYKEEEISTHLNNEKLLSLKIDGVVGKKQNKYKNISTNNKKILSGSGSLSTKNLKFSFKNESNSYIYSISMLSASFSYSANTYVAYFDKCENIYAGDVFSPKLLFIDQIVIGGLKDYASEVTLKEIDAVYNFGPNRAPVAEYVVPFNSGVLNVLDLEKMSNNEYVLKYNSSFDIYKQNFSILVHPVKNGKVDANKTKEFKIINQDVNVNSNNVLRMTFTDDELRKFGDFSSLVFEGKIHSAYDLSAGKMEWYSYVNKKEALIKVDYGIKGHTIYPPTAQKIAGKSFDGWYEDKEYKILSDFNSGFSQTKKKIYSKYI